MLLDNRRNTLGRKLREWINRHSRIAPRFKRKANRLFHIVIDINSFRRQSFGANDLKNARDAFHLLKMRQVQDDRELLFLRNEQLSHKRLFLIRRYVIKANLANRHATRMLEIFRHPVNHARSKRDILAFFRIHPDRTPVINTAPARTHRLKIQNEIKIIPKAFRPTTILTEPETGFNTSPNTRIIHCVVIVRRPCQHMNMWLYNRVIAHRN